MRASVNESSQTDADGMVDLSIDVDQWRHDIKTFADTTNQALAAIMGQLSTSCTSDKVPEPEVLNDESPIVAEPENEMEMVFPTETGDAELAKLKSQLAQRMISG